MQPLAGFQRRYLRGLGHGLKPVVVVGKAGLSAGLHAKARRELAAHELIKVRFAEFKAERKALTDEIARETGSEVVGRTGHTALLFRPHPDPAQRRIKLPGPPPAAGDAP